MGLLCTIYFCLINSQFSEQKDRGTQRWYKNTQEDGKMEPLTLKEITCLLSNCLKAQTPVRKTGEMGKPNHPPPSRSKRHSLILQFPSNRKVPHPLKKYCIISVYWHLLLSKIQPQPSPFSPSSLILPTRLSQSFEHNRLTTLLSHHQFL